MKKLSLFTILTAIGTFSFAQVIFQVQAPSTPTNLQNTYPMTWAYDPAFVTWSTPDLNNPANSVTAPLEFVDDGDIGLDPTYGFPANRDACTALINNLTGKIAVMYRGTCEFGFKAVQAMDAGAVGVIIINHTGAPVGMGGGAMGLTDTIPTIMISEQDGALLEAAIAAGTITQGFIGNKFGIFADDLGMGKGDVLRARRFANLAFLSQDATEFSVPVGSWVRNVGNQTQNGATLTATIDMGGQIYNQTGSVPTIAPGDSVWVGLPTFSQFTYPTGYYTMTYNLTTSPNPDGEPSDNMVDANFMISDSLYSYGRLDSATSIPLSPAGYRSGGFATDWEGCLAFDDANASRATALGMTISATTSSTDVLTNEFVEVRVYQWDDVFTDIYDPGLDFLALTQLDAAFFVYGSDLQDVPVFIPLSQPLTLTDNQRYLFCLNSPSQLIFAGYDSQIDYWTTQDDDALGANGAHLQPSIPGAADGAYFLNGFGLDVQLAASVQIQGPVSVDELANEITIVPFPNPTVDVLNIPVGNRNGSATIELYDVAGKLVISKVVTFSNNETLSLDLSTLSNGSYVANMVFEDATAKFNVVVNK